MAGIKKLRRIQLGQEGTAGTETAATAVWLGMGVLQDNREVVFVDEDVGYISGIDRTYIPQTEGAITFEAVEATFEQVQYLFEGSINNVGTGTQDTGGDGYIYTYTLPTTSTNSVQTFTIEGGDNQQEEQMLYSFCDSWTLTGAGGEAVMMSGEWVGQGVAKGTFTTQPSLATVEEILFGNAKLYIDSAGGTAGSTQVSNTLLDFEVSYDSGIVPKYTADGSLDFSFIQYTMPELLINVTFEHNTSAVTEKDNWRNETARLMRLELLGSAFATAGSSYSNKTVIIDAAGKWESFEALSDQDGNDVISGSFRARYNTTAQTFGQVVVVNEQTTLT